MSLLDAQDWGDFCRGNADALERIYHRHRSSMYSYCVYISGNTQLSEDTVQEAFLRLMKEKTSLRIRTELKNWLFICVRNLLFNALQKQKRESIADFELSSMTSELDAESRLFIQQILSRLGPEERELVILREQQGFTISELAEILAISEEAVRVRLYRVRKKMQELARCDNER